MAAAVATPGGPVAGDPGLRRDIGFMGLIWASEGSIIGSGWLLGALVATEYAGPAALFAWVIGSFIVMLLALVHAELGGMFPVAGGTARFPHYAYGSLVGFAFSWYSWLQAAAVAPIEVEAVMTYGASYAHWMTNSVNGTLSFPAGFLLAVALMAIFCFINFMGIKVLSLINTYATWWKVIVPVFALIVLFIARFHTSNFTADGGFAPFGLKGVLDAVAAGGVVFAVLGFEQAVQLGAESANPQRDIPRAVIGAMIIGIVIYMLLQIVFIGALSPADLAHGWPGITFPSSITGPYAGLATGAGLGWLATILYIDAIISPGGTGLIYLTATSRISYGASRNGYIPTFFEKLTQSNGVPWGSIIVAFIAGIFFFLPFPSWQSMVGLITSASVLMYAGAPLAFGALRRTLPDHVRPFRLGGGTVIAPISFIGANFIIYWSGWNVDWKLFCLIAAGFAVLWASMTFGNNPNKPKLDWHSATWLWPYLVGMALISYLGQYNEGADSAGRPYGLVKTLNNYHIPFYWDLGVIAVFSLVIYFWAISLRLPAEKVNEYVSTVQPAVDAHSPTLGSEAGGIGPA
ncbi:MAG: APC family permease [Candidatus Dormiibacterota bacterium]